MLTAIIVMLSMKMCQQGIRIDSLTSLANEQEVRILADGTSIISQQQNILTLKDALKLEKLEKEKYMKSVQAQAKVGVVNVVTEKKVVYHDTVERLVYVDTSYDGMFDSSTFIKVPLVLEYRDSWNLFQGTLYEEEFVIDSLMTKNELRFTLGYEKQGLFKKAKPVVEVKSSNPSASVTIKDNVIVEEPKPFYKRVWFGIVLGVGGTLLLL